MATVIRFVGDSELMLRVQEDVEGVARALTTASRGSPFKLTFEANGAPVYVNPEGIAYWFSAGDGNAGPAS